jgi:CheY-like chemotaxis protein
MDKDTKWVLIVDDDLGSRQIFEKHLKAMGFETVLANDGEDAIDILATGPRIDLIITDVMMPFVSGFDFTNKLKQQADTKNIPVIGTSAFHDWKKSREEGALIVDEFVPKPVSREQLAAAINTVMNK